MNAEQKNKLDPSFIFFCFSHLMLPIKPFYFNPSCLDAHWQSLALIECYSVCCVYVTTWHIHNEEVALPMCYLKTTL